MPTQNTPFRNSPTSSDAASIASRVFPDPPGPVNVIRRAPSRRRLTTSVTSRSLPTKLDAGRGRFVFEIVFSGGNDPSPSWNSDTGSAKSFNRCSPRSSTSSSTRARVARVRRIWPPCPALITRAAR
jgi:hypothetical protein